MPTLRRLAAVIVVEGAMLLSPAFAAGPVDPFPDQPGVLSPAEIQDATAAMHSMLAGEPAPPLVASGRRGPEHALPGYALFATPLVALSDRVRTRRQVICNFFRPVGKWQCTKPQTEFRMTAQGIEHVFPYVADSGAEDKQAALDVADFMYSQCFVGQFKALGGDKPAPTFNPLPITTVVSDSGGFTVRTGPDEQPDVYRIEKTDRTKDHCGFRIVDVRMSRSGTTVVLPASHAREMAEMAEQAAKDAAASRAKELALQEERARAAAPLPGILGAYGLNRAEAMNFAAMICGLAALVVPWLVLIANRRAAAVVAGVLAVTGTFLFLMSNQDMVRGNIRIDLFIIPALLLVAWAEFAGMGGWSLRREPEPPAGTAASRVLSRIGWAVAGIVGASVLAVLLIFAIPEILTNVAK